MNLYQAGQCSAFVQLGLVKEADVGPVLMSKIKNINSIPFRDTVRNWAQKIGPAAKKFMPTGDKVKTFVKGLKPTRAGAKKFLIGDTRGFAHELLRGDAFRSGGMLRESLWPESSVGKVFRYGFPAYNIAQTLRDDNPDKARRIGATVGENVLGGLGSPLGFVGSNIMGGLGKRIGGGIGQTAEYLATGKGPHTLPPPPLRQRVPVNVYTQGM